MAFVSRFIKHWTNWFNGEMEPMRRAMWLSAILALGAFAILAACSQPEEATPVPPTEAVAATTAATTAPTATAAATATPLPTRAARPDPTRSVEVAPDLQPTRPSVSLSRSGGTLRASWADPPTLDPALVTDSTSYGIVIEVFSGLMKIDVDGQVVNDLAESFTVSDDGKTYRFKLRDGLEFSDGSPVTASDFKWSWERAALPDTESPIVEEFLGDIIGISDIIDGGATAASGIQVIDEQTLEVRIDAPKPYFIAKLTYPITFVVSRDNVERGGDSWTDSPVGTGPFVLDDYTIGVQIVLARNDYYWGELAHLDTVRLTLAGGSRMAQYENDEIDITGVSLADLERVRNPDEPINRDLVTVQPGFTTSYIGYNVDEPPFDDINFRKALNYAFDKELVAETIYSGLVRPATGIIPPGFVGFNEDLRGYDFDLDKAQEHLAMSKYAEERPRIVITSSGTGGSPTLVLEVLADQWRKNLGIEVEIEQVEWATYLQDLHRNRLQAFSLGWSADYPDPHTFIDVLFRSDSSINNTNYSNPDVDANLARAAVEPDPAKRIQLYQETEQMIMDDAPWLTLWWGVEGYALVKQHVKGYTFPPMTSPKYQYVWIEESVTG